MRLETMKVYLRYYYNDIENILTAVEKTLFVYAH